MQFWVIQVVIWMLTSLIFQLSQHSQPAVTAAGDHVADFGPGVQVWVIDFHRVNGHRGREVSAGSSTTDSIQQPIDS